MKAFDSASIKDDLYRYFHQKASFFSPEFCRVVADVSKFTSDIVNDGFDTAFVRFVACGDRDPYVDRPFIEVAELIAEHHIRFVRGAARDIVRKSLSEAYTHVAGPRYVLEPVTKT